MSENRRLDTVELMLAVAALIWLASCSLKLSLILETLERRPLSPAPESPNVKQASLSIPEPSVDPKVREIQKKYGLGPEGLPGIQVPDKKLGLEVLSQARGLRAEGGKRLASSTYKFGGGE
jgi:hypothetical protein